MRSRADMERVFAESLHESLDRLLPPDRLPGLVALLALLCFEAWEIFER